MTAANTQTLSSTSLAVEQLSCVRGDRSLFENLSFSLNAGEALQIHGANGSGKTSLLRILAGLSQPEQGNIYWNTDDIHKNNTNYLNSIHYIGHSSGIKLDLTPSENLSFQLGLSNIAATLDIETALEKVELYGFENEIARTLSAGQRRRITMARLVMMPAQLWLLDEPFTALDAQGCKLMQNLLNDHIGNGGLAVLVSHSPINLNMPLHSIQLKT